MVVRINYSNIFDEYLKKIDIYKLNQLFKVKYMFKY